jgi:hypothetical protein
MPGQAQRPAPTRRFVDRGHRFSDYGPSSVGAGFHACPRLRVDVTLERRTQRPTRRVLLSQEDDLRKPISKPYFRTARVSQIMLQPSLQVSNSSKL